jgi:hypothetical protein
MTATAAQAQVNPRAAYLNNLMANAQMLQGAGGGFNPAVNPGFAPGAFVNPYTPVSGGFNNPYTPGGLGGGPGLGYGGGFGGYGYATVIPPQGFFLMGTAQIMQAYGSVVTADQQARIMAEQAEQAHIDTLKRRFEYEMFVKANTIPYSEVQRKIFKQTATRVRTLANPSEIASGRSANILLQDLETGRGKKIAIEPISLSEDVLKHLNVTTKNGNLGVLRNDGRISWPPALIELLPKKEREEIDYQTQALVQNAIAGVVPGNVLRDLQTTIEKIGERLFKKINTISGDDYRVAKKFLEDLDSARVALGEPGNAVAYINFQKWAGGGKTVQELVDYVQGHGLKFAPAVQGDEFAYRALQGALATYDMAYNRQMAGEAAPKDE